MNQTRRLQSYICGKPCVSENAKTIKNQNPATGEILSEIEIAGKKQVDLGVEAAKTAFGQWSSMTGAERGRILIDTARLLRARNNELAHMEVLDTGKAIQEAVEVDINSAAECLEYFGGMAAGLKGDHFTLGNNFAYTRREPLGVVCGIGAWNYPLQIACWKAAPALASGNCMIFKPSEFTSSTAVQLAAIFEEAGLPPGVFNVILGDGDTGRLLVEHKGIAKVSLTGSVATGKAVYRGCVDTLKSVTLELGGKSPLIIFSDANIDDAISAAMVANFYTQGEICSNGTRVFVHEDIKEEFLTKLLSRTKKLKIGDPLDPEVQVGTLISADHFEKVAGYVESGKKEGAKLLCGGVKPSHLAGTPFEKGHFMEPAIFDCPSDDLTIVKEEIFGPVMSVLTFKDEDDVIQRANDTEFGLAAGVMTRDLSRGHRVVARLEAGMCWINNYNITPIEIPFGGYKMSGIGRENSEKAFDYYTKLKTVYVETGRVESPYE
jgi:betaine-aldehyde dehydrogenase